MTVRFAAIVVAAGKGVRFGRPKQLVAVGGRPLVAWSIAAFASMPELNDLVIATEAEYAPAMAALAAHFAPRFETTVVSGGATRQESVRLALAAVPAHCDAAFIHDGARPLVQPRDVRAGMAATRPGTGALLAEPVTDTIKIVRAGSRAVSGTLDRSELWAAQTPQFGTLHDLRRAHDAARREGVLATDDAMLLERIGCEVIVVPASGDNFKVTQPGDDLVAEAILRERSSAAALR